MGALADAGGRLRNPGAGGSVYMAAVVIVAAGVVYFDRKKRSTANSAFLAVLAGTYRAGNDPPRRATDIAVRAQLRVVPYNPVTRDCDSCDQRGR